MNRVKLIVVVTTTAVTGSAWLAGSPVAASAHPTSGYAYRVLAGSGRYLAYEKVATRADGELAAEGTLYYRTTHGHAHSLGQIRRTGYAQLAGSTLIYADAADSDSVHDVDLRTGVDSAVGVSLAMPPTKDGSFMDVVVAPAPNGGYVVDQHRLGEERRPDVLYLESGTGQETRLGTPEPDGSTFSVETSATTLVVDEHGFADTNTGSAKDMSFAHPGTFHTLLPTGQTGDESACSVTTSLIACHRYDSTVHHDVRLFSTTGKLISQASTRCDGYGDLVLNRSLAWVTDPGAHCASHTLVVVSHHGRRRTVPGSFSASTTVAFDGVVTGRKQVKHGWYRQLALVTESGRTRTLAGPTQSASVHRWGLTVGVLAK